jgi:hypothetical protein
MNADRHLELLKKKDSGLFGEVGNEFPGDRAGAKFGQRRDATRDANG